MTFSQPSVSPRVFRSPDYRDLVERAIEQGFDVYRTGSDHIAVVNPLTGQRVTMSTSGSTRSGHALGNVRAALMRAGLDLRSKAERRRDRKQHKEATAMPKGSLLTDDQRAEIAERRERGETIVHVAEVMGLSTKTVGNHQPEHLKQPPSEALLASVHARSGGVTPEMEARMVELKEAGKKNVEIAQELGISDTSVWKHLPDKYKKPSRYKTVARSGPVERVKPTVEAPAEGPTESVVDIVKRVNQEFGDYPLIRQLVAKQTRYSKMLTEAEAIGDDDLQLLLLDKTKMSGLEAEAVRLWQATQTHDNGNGSKH